MTVFDIIAEPLIIHGIGDAKARAELVSELVNLVGLDLRHLRRYPHSFSAPAAAHRHRPGLGVAPRSGDLRRAGFGARRVDSGADLEPVDRP